MMDCPCDKLVIVVSAVLVLLYGHTIIQMQMNALLSSV